MKENMKITIPNKPGTINDQVPMLRGLYDVVHMSNATNPPITPRATPMTGQGGE